MAMATTAQLPLMMTACSSAISGEGSCTVQNEGGEGVWNVFQLPSQSQGGGRVRGAPWASTHARRAV
jgi:hypothetical protein